MSAYAYGRVHYESIDRHCSQERYRPIRRAETLGEARERCEALADASGSPIAEWVWGPMDGMWFGVTDESDKNRTADGWYVQAS